MTKLDFPRARGRPRALTTALLFSTALAGCASDPCSITDNGDGSATFECPDGSSATLYGGIDGRDAEPCSVTDNGDGTATLTCPDGSAADLAGGEPGADGLDAEPCTIADNGDGTATITCPDGTMATVTNGADGLDASPCTVADNGDGTATLSCPDGSSVTWSVAAQAQAPVASFVVDEPEAEAPRTLAFDAAASFDPDGLLVSYAWNFGGGAAPRVTSVPYASATFTTAGSFVVTLTVFDNQGKSASATQSVVLHPNPLANGDFEDASGGLPADWTTGAYSAQGVSFTWAPGCGRNGSACVGIEAPVDTPNDAWWMQSVMLTPGAAYNLYGWIKGEAITGGGTGANLCLVGTWEHSESTGSLGSFDWKEVVFTFLAPDTGEASIGARLGYWASTVSGRVWFDDVALTTDDFARPRAGEHVVLRLERQDLDAIAPEAVDTWLAHLDAAYITLADLVGDTPYDGAPIEVLSVRQYPGGWAVAGNPIRWQERYVQDTLISVEALDNWSFGILHELSHDFDLEGRWSFQGEFMANFKVYYVATTLAAHILVENVLYEGATLRDYYRLRHYEAEASGAYNWNALTYRFIVIAETLGWTPFKLTYRAITGLDPASVPTTALGKFDLFVDTLSSVSGTNVRALFTAEELAFIEANLAGGT